MGPDARRSIRWLETVLFAAIFFPILVFCLSAWQTYQDIQRISDDQISRSRDVLSEHALKVFEAVERSIAEINEIIRDASDSEIAANERALNLRLQRMVSSSPEMKSIWIFDAQGRALASSMTVPAPPMDFSDRDYFRPMLMPTLASMSGGPETKTAVRRAALLQRKRPALATRRIVCRRNPSFRPAGIL